MAMHISFKHMDVSPALKFHAQESLAKRIGRLVSKHYNAALSLEVDQLDHVAKLHVHVDSGVDLQLEERCPNMYSAIDQLGRKLDRVLVKQKDKKISARRQSAPKLELEADDAIDAEEILQEVKDQKRRRAAH